MAKKVTFYIPEGADAKVERFLQAQSSKGHTFVAMVCDAIQKYGYTDYVLMKLSGEDERGEMDEQTCTDICTRFML